MNEMENILRKELTSGIAPDEKLNKAILQQAKEIKTMKNRPFKTSVAAAILAGILVIGSVTAYAAYHFLTPSQVAKTLTESKALSQAFESSEAILENETQKTGGYDVTFLGTVTGKNLIPAIRNAQDAGNIQKDLTYVVIAIQKSDGNPMPSTMDPEYKTFCVSPLIHGKNFMEMNNGTIDAGVYSFVQDGVQYELLECKNLQPFAKEGVSIGVVERFGEEPEAFDYDASTGIHSRNKNYQKVNALFELPFH